MKNKMLMKNQKDVNKQFKSQNRNKILENTYRCNRINKGMGENVIIISGENSQESNQYEIETNILQFMIGRCMHVGLYARVERKVVKVSGSSPK